VNLTCPACFLVQPVPIEALLPFGIIAGFFALTGTGLQAVKYYSNDKKVRIVF
jgi:hypothetical protein